MNDRKYLVRRDWIFNLESMNDRLWCIIYDARDGELTFPVTIANTECKDEHDIQTLIDECGELEIKAKRGRVTSKEYGRIKSIVEWRVMVRYMKCLESGMDERRAGECFNDL